jgi:hypothetical protein
VISCSSDRQEFFPIGGESPESFLSVFSDDVIQASFNVCMRFIVLAAGFLLFCIDFSLAS